jgi:hypothetical protein
MPTKNPIAVSVLKTMVFAFERSVAASAKSCFLASVTDALKSVSAVESWLCWADVVTGAHAVAAGNSSMAVRFVRGRLGVVRGGEGDEEAVVDLGVEDGDADAVAGQGCPLPRHQPGGLGDLPEVTPYVVSIQRRPHAAGEHQTVTLGAMGVGACPVIPQRAERVHAPLRHRQGAAGPAGFGVVPARTERRTNRDRGNTFREIDPSTASIRTQTDITEHIGALLRYCPRRGLTRPAWEVW